MTTTLNVIDDESDSQDESLKILLADDDADSRAYLKILLTSSGHQVIEAVDGQQAIEKYRKEKPDIVLMDVIMPVVDGYEATKTIKAIDKNEHIPVLFITSLTDDNSLLKCIDAGGDDFLTKPYNAILLYAKLSAHARIRNLTRGLKKKNDLLDYFRTHTEIEYKIAERVFSKRLAIGQINSPFVKHHFSSMAILNGDIFQCITTPSEDIYILLGDFTGHGLAAATGTLPVSDIFISLTGEERSISSIAETLNSLLKEILPSDMFCATTLMRLDRSRQFVEIWSGGLPDTFLINSNSQEIIAIPSQHMPLGILSKKTFQSDTQVIQLTPNDRLYLYTDGLTETMNRENEMFGEERLKEMLVTLCQDEDAIEKIIAQLMKFSNTDAPQDDLSIVSLSAKPWGSTSDASS